MVISVVVAVIILLSSFAIYATIHDAAGGGGSSGSLPGSSNSVTGDFANTSDYPIAGLRLSIVNVNTGQTKGTNRDIVTRTDSMYSSRQMFSEKYNKVQMKNNYTGSFHLMNTTDSYNSLSYADSNNKGMDDITPYRSGDSIAGWERKDRNLQAAASYIIYGDGSHKYDSLSTLLAPGDRIVIEALYPIKVDGKGYFMTCSEYATFYAQRYAGSAYDSAFTNSGNSGSPFYIGKTLGRYLPSGMFAPDGSLENCGIGKAASLAGQATYRQLITQGYGMHVAYTDDRPPAPTTCNLEVLERFALLRQDASGNYWIDYEYAPGDNTGKQIYRNVYTVTKGSTIKVGYYSSSRTLAGNENGDFPIFSCDGSVPTAYHADRWWTSDGSAGGTAMSDTFTINSDKTLVITYVPNTFKFTVNEYFDMVYDDGYTAGSIYKPGEVGIKENLWRYTTDFNVIPGTTISIGDYIRPKTENNRTDGKWIDFPSTPYTDKNWAEYNYVGSGKTFKTKWNYHFDGSYANGLTEKTDNLNEKYTISSNGITINVHYKPDDVDMNLRTVYKKYNPATHKVSSYTLSRDKNQYYPMTYMNINDSGYLKRPDAFTQDEKTAGTVGNPYYFLTYTQWKSEGYKEASEEVYQNKCWHGYTYSADNKDGENTKYENGKLDFLMCKKVNNIDAVYEANLANYTVEYYVNEEIKPRKRLTGIYYQPEGDFYDFKQEGENFDAKRYFLSPSEFNAEYKMSVDENATIDYAVIERTVNGKKTVERITKDSLWKVTMNDNNAVIRIYYNEPAELTVNHYVDGEFKFSDNKICRSGRTFTANLPASLVQNGETTVIGDTVNISKDFVKTPNFFIDNYDVYAVIKGAEYRREYDEEKTTADDINNFSITFNDDSNIIVDLYYEAPKINATVEYYLNESTTPFATETFNPKGYIKFDGKYGQEGDLISASNFIFTSDALNEKYGDNIKNMPGRYNEKARPDTVVEAISYSTTGGDAKKVIGRDNVKGNDANYKINSMDDLTIKVYYCEPIELTVSYWVDGQQIDSKLTKEYLPSSRVLNIDGESVTVQGTNYTLEKYAEDTKGLSDVGVKLDYFYALSEKYTPDKIKTEFSTSNQDEQASLHYSTSVGLTVVFNVFNTETQEYEKFFEYTYENDFKKNTKFDKDTLDAVMNGANAKLTGTKFDTFLGVQNAQLKMNENNLIGGFSATHKNDNQVDVTNTYQLDSANFNKSTTLALTGDKTDATITDDSLNRMIMQYATNTLELYYDAPFKRVTFNYNYLMFDKDNVNSCKEYDEAKKVDGITGLDWASLSNGIGKYNEDGTTEYALKYHDYAEKVITVTDTIKVHVDENYTINKEKPEHESHKKVFNGEVWWEKDAATKYHIPYDTPCDFQSDLFLKTDYSGENGSEKTVACSVSENNPSLPDSFSYDALNSNTTYDFYYKPTQYKIVYDKNSISAIVQGVNNEDKNAVKEKTEVWQKTGKGIKLPETLFANFGENLNGWTACDLNTGLWYGYRDYGSVVELGWHKYSDLIKNVNDAKYESYKGKITKDGCYLFAPAEETNFSNAKTWGTIKLYAQWGEEDKEGKLEVFFSMNSTPNTTDLVGSSGNELNQFDKSLFMNPQYLSADKDNYLRTNTFARDGYDFIGWKLQLVRKSDNSIAYSQSVDTSDKLYGNTIHSKKWYKFWSFTTLYHESLDKNTANKNYWRTEKQCIRSKIGIFNPSYTYFDPFKFTSSVYGSTGSSSIFSGDYGGVLVDDNGFVDLKKGMITSNDYDKYCIIAYAQWKKASPKFTVVFQDAAGRPAWNDSNKHLVSINYETTKEKTFGFEDTYDTTSSHFTSQGFAKYGKIVSDNLKIRLYNLEENYEVDKNNSWRDNTNNYDEIGIKYNGEAKENKPIVKFWTDKNEAHDTLNSDTWVRYSAKIENGNKIIVTLYADYNIKYDRNQGQGENDIFTDKENNALDISKDYTVLGYGTEQLQPKSENETFTPLLPEKYVGCEKYRVYRTAREGLIYIPEEDSWDFGLVETDVKRYLAYNGDKLDWYTEDEIAKNNYKYYYIKSGNNFGPETINGINNFNYLVHKGDTVYFEAQWQAKVNIKFVTAEGAEPFVKDDKVWNSMLSVVNTQNPTIAISTVGIKNAEDVYFNGANGYFNTDENYIAKILLSNKNDGTPISDNNSNMLSFEYNPATGASEYPDQLYGKELRLKDNERWSHYSIDVTKKDKEPDLVTVTLYDKYYNIEYDANGGRNTMQGQKAISGEQITLNKNLFERDNFSYRFWYASYQNGGNTYWYGYKGNATEPSWQLEKDLTRKYAFSDEEKVVFNFTNKVTVTMHAQWAADFTVEYVDENGNPAFDSWNNKVSYSCDENGTYKWLSTTTKSTSSYYPLDVINKDTAQTEMKVSAALGHSSAISSSYTDFVFKYKINEGVMKADNVQYDKIVLINQNGVSPIEAKKWNAYKLEIVDAHKVRITLLKFGYTIQYDCNGENVNGSMNSQTAYPYEPIQLSRNAFTRENFMYRFWYASRSVNNVTLWYGYSDATNESTLGWYSADKVKKYYAFSDASIVRFNVYNETITMHAQWAAKFTVSYVDENGNPAFDSWYNTVTYHSKADGKSYWLTPVGTRSSNTYYSNEMFNKIRDDKACTLYTILYNYNTSSTAKGVKTFMFDYNINNGVAKRAKVEYDKVVHFNEKGISPIEDQRWNAYKLEIPNEHEVKITLYRLDYTINYDANGGTGNMSTDKALPNTDYTVKTNAFTKSETVKNQVLSSKFRYWYAEDENHNWYGYTTAGDKSTLGWYSSDKIKEYYKVAEGEKLNLNKWGGSVTLHAQWLTPFLIDYVDNNYQPLFTDEDPIFKYWCMAVRIKYKSSTEEKNYLAYTRRGDVVYMTSETDYPTSGRDGKITMKKNPINGIVADNQTGKNMMALFLDNDWDSGLKSYVPVFFNYETNKGLSKYSGQIYDKEKALTGNKYFSQYKLEVVSPSHLRVVLTPKTITVNYDGNGGLGTMNSDTTRFGVPYNVKENGFFKPYESNFRCWYLYDNDAKAWYGYSKFGDETTLGWYQGKDLKQYYEVKENEQLPLGNKTEGSVTLYAQWFTPFTVSYVKNQYNAETGMTEKVPAFDKWNNYVFGSGLHSDKGSAVNSSFNDTDKPYMKFPFSQEYFYGGTQHAGYFGKTLKYKAAIGRDKGTSYAGYITMFPFYYNTNTGVAEDQNPTYQCQNCYFYGMRGNMKNVDGHYYCPKCNYQFADNFYDTIIKFGNRAPTGFYAYEMSILNQNEIEITFYTKDELVDHYDVHYDKNSDEALGTMKSSHHYFDEPFTLDKCAFTRNGYNFRGWAVRDDATGNYLCYDVNGNKVWASEGKQVIVEDQCENVNFPILDVPKNNGSITFVAQWQAGFNVHFITQYGAKAFTSWNSAVRYEDNTYSSLSRSTSPDTRYFAANDNIAVGAKFESYVCFGNTPDAALSPASLDNLNVVRFNYDAENGISMSDKQKYDTKIPIENCEDWTAYSVAINEITGDIYITLYEPPRELSINYYQPNANYTCGTTVIATFKVTNKTKYNYNPDDGIATMTVTMTGENGTDTPYQYGTYTKDFVIPARKSQNVYFKIPIPLDTATEHIRITANITYEGVVIAEYDITTNDGKSGYTTMTTVVGKMKTPEYGYNTKVPTNYKYLTADEVPSKRLANAASWDEYVYIGNGKYEKKTYYSLMRLDAGSTRPNAYCPVWWFNNDKNSKLDKPNFYKLMRSGYGLDVFYSSGFYTSDRIARLTNGVPCTDTNAFVPAQVSKIYYPENNYGAFALSDEFFDIYANRTKTDVSKDVLYDTVFASHYWNRVSNDWVASTEITGDQFNTASRTYFAKIKHMTPMWVKDGDYAVQPVATDAWTPAGMLSAGNVIDTTGIEGSMYDDWRWVSGQTK